MQQGATFLLTTGVKDVMVNLDWRNFVMGRPAAEIDTDILVDLLESGTSLKDASKELGISQPTLSKQIAKIQKEQGLILQYRALQNLQLTKLQAEVLDKITPQKIEEASLRDLVFAYKVLKDKELVVTGKPTEIKGFVHYLLQLEREEMALQTPTEVDPDSIDLEEDESGNFKEIPDL
jgi:DNA-binding Lrp family transcriptional regulator